MEGNVQFAVAIAGVVLNLLVTLLAGLLFRTIRDVREQVRERKDEAKEIKDDLLGRLKETREDVREVRDRQDRHDERHTEALRRVVDSLPQTYVDRRDYVRTMAGQDKKMDQVLTVVLGIQKDFQDHVSKESRA